MVQAARSDRQRSSRPGRLAAPFRSVVMVLIVAPRVRRPSLGTGAPGDQGGTVAVPTSIKTDIDLHAAGELAQQLRVDSIRSSTSAGSGHPTSSMSAADLLAVLVGRHLRYDWDDPG